MLTKVITTKDVNANDTMLSEPRVALKRVVYVAPAPKTPIKSPMLRLVFALSWVA
jgi:hypothetical protein